MGTPGINGLSQQDAIAWDGKVVNLTTRPNGKTSEDSETFTNEGFIYFTGKNYALFGTRDGDHTEITGCVFLDDIASIEKAT